MSREDIQCPGDIIPFNCSILSNSETIHLMWLITIPGMTPVNVTFFNNSGSDDLTSYITTFVTGFKSDEYIHSTVEFRVQPGIPVNRFNLSCSITGLGLSITAVRVNSSCKSNITRLCDDN